VCKRVHPVTAWEAEQGANLGEPVLHRFVTEVLFTNRLSFTNPLGNKDLAGFDLP
jgi:hypothetical protein